jgi:hypothetical protein
MLVDVFSKAPVQENLTSQVSAGQYVYTTTQPFNFATLQVYVNGLKQRNPSDVTFISHNQFRLSSQIEDGDTVEAVFLPL